MTMKSLNALLDAVQSIVAQTVSGSNVGSGDIDLDGFNAAEIVAHFGDIDEMGGSPVGSAKMDVRVEHADDDGTGSAGTYADATAKDVVGKDVQATITSGVVMSATTDLDTLQCSYVGDKRFIRVTLQPTALTNGGPAGVIVAMGEPRHAPQHDTQI